MLKSPLTYAAWAGTKAQKIGLISRKITFAPSSSSYGMSFHLLRQPEASSEIAKRINITNSKNMIQQLENLPVNMVGFKATGEITERDFSETVMPNVKALINKTDQLNYLMVLETPIKNFSIGAWMKDAVMGIKHLTKWNRAAIVSDVEAIRKFTNFFSYLMPGEFRGFEHKDLQLAIDWVAEKNN
ncbi:MAG: STAS/SEC14 domain-containing protein [Flavobacteriales bacterium]|nr:STAS/SEC14 domain-containing protein [Flavobacteriales bacterium]